MPLHHLFRGYFFEPAWPTGVMPINLVLQLISRKDHFLSVNDDNMITDIEVRRIGCLVFSHQQPGRYSRKPPNCLTVGVEDEPVAGLLKVLPARNKCLHDTNLQICRKEK